MIKGFFPPKLKVLQQVKHFPSTLTVFEHQASILSTQSPPPLIHNNSNSLIQDAVVKTGLRKDAGSTVSNFLLLGQPVSIAVHLIFLRPDISHVCRLIRVISGYSSDLQDYQFINYVCYIDHYGKNWTRVKCL